MAKIQCGFGKITSGFAAFSEIFSDFAFFLHLLYPLINIVFVTLVLKFCQYNFELNFCRKLKKNPPGSEITEFWSFLEFLLEKSNRVRGSELLDFLEFVLKK